MAHAQLHAQIINVDKKINFLRIKFSQKSQKT